VAKGREYLVHLNSSEDLITPHASIRAGFIALSLAKNNAASPIVSEARTLKALASQALHPSELMGIEGISAALLIAAGVSDKAANYMDENDKKKAIRGLIKNFLEPAGPDFLEELIYRFLITRGDALGGKMRNLAGILAQQKISRTIISTLKIAGISYHWLESNSNKWISQKDDDAEIELKLKGIAWVKSNKMRTLIYNIKPPFVGKNVDLCLFNCSFIKVNSDTYKNPNFYIALGELKGGIDPAGADERWKTAKSALNNIRKCFSDYGLNPKIFFLGASITKSMANEIWYQLESRVLNNAANFTNENQVTPLCNWLVNL